MFLVCLSILFRNIKVPQKPCTITADIPPNQITMPSYVAINSVIFVKKITILPIFYDGGHIGLRNE